MKVTETKERYFGVRIGGSVVECSPATRAARVRFPADAKSFCQAANSLLNVFPAQIL